MLSLRDCEGDAEAVQRIERGTPAVYWRVRPLSDFPNLILKMWLWATTL